MAGYKGRWVSRRFGEQSINDKRENTDHIVWGSQGREQPDWDQARRLGPRRGVMPRGYVLKVETGLSWGLVLLL